MNDLKDDSVFVLRVILILGVFFMFCYSKTGTYLWFLIGAIVVSLYMHYANQTPLVNQLIFSTIFISIAFELIYPFIFHYNKSTFLNAKRDFADAREELKRRKDKAKINDEFR
jgi:hypothetical protein